MDKYQFFWDVMELCDWAHEGDDEKVLKPVVAYLSKQEDSTIFAFDDLMSELLYALDTRKLADQCAAATGYTSGDVFLYSRCVALINGPQYYQNAKSGGQPGMWNMEFEALLYTPAKAWAAKYKKTAEEYPHISPLSYETGSNKDGWN